MEIGSLKNRRDEIVTRMLEIEADLSERKRKWAAGIEERPLAERAALEAEYARLKLEKNHIDISLHAGKVAARAVKEATFTATLVRLLQERGMSELVMEAERAALDAALSI